MLSHDDAQKRLATFHSKNWEKLRLEEMGTLPEKLRIAGRALLERDANGKAFKNWQKRQESQQAATEMLEKSSAKDRQRIFAVLFPQLAAHLEACWQLLTRLPYETSSDRKGFRAPGNAEAYRTARQRLAQPDHQFTQGL